MYKSEATYSAGFSAAMVPDFDKNENLYGVQFPAGVVLDTIEFYFGQHMSVGDVKTVNVKEFKAKTLMSKYYAEDIDQFFWRQSKLVLSHESIMKMLKRNIFPGYNIKLVEDKIEIKKLKKIAIADCL